MPESRVGGIAASVALADLATARAVHLLNGNIYFTDKAAWTPGGTLTVSGLADYDRVSILHQGNGAGEVGVDGTTILYGGVAIGTASGGNGTTLTVTFNNAATADAVTAVTERVAYWLGAGGTVSDHSLHLALVDGAGVAAANAGQWEQVGDAVYPAYDIGALVTTGLFRPVLGDLNGDGYADLVLTGNPEDIIEWHVVDYDDPAYLAWEENVRSPIYNFDENGVLIIRDGELIKPGTKVFINDKHGGFIAIDQNITSSGKNVWASLADADGDGDLDLFWTHAGPSSSFRSIAVSYNSGNGYFNGYSPFADFFDQILADGGWDRATFVAAGDLDANGSTEAFVGLGYTTVRVNAGGGGAIWQQTGAYTGVQVTAGQEYYGKPFLLDYDGDGDLDALLLQGGTRYFDNVGGGTLVERFGSANPFAGLLSYNDGSAFGDLDHDGDLDLLAIAPDGSTRVAWNNSSYGARSNSTDGDIKLDFGFEGEPAGRVALGGIAAGVTFADAAAARATHLLNGNVYLTDKGAWTPGGTLTVSGLADYDRVSILGQGNGAGQVGVDGSTILYGGVAIGTVSGGVGSTLTVTFNSSATADAVTAVTERIAYRMGPGGTVSDHSLQIALVDGAGVAAANAGQWEQLSDDAHTGYDIASLVTPHLFRPLLGDINGDGYADLILTGNFEEVIDWRVQNYDDPEFAAWEETLRYPIQMVDENGVIYMRDGDAGNPGSKVYLNDQHGGFVAAGDAGTGTATNVTGSLFDYTGDGLADFFWSFDIPVYGERPFNLNYNLGGHFAANAGQQFSWVGGDYVAPHYRWDQATYFTAGTPYPGGPVQIFAYIAWGAVRVEANNSILMGLLPGFDGTGEGVGYAGKPIMLDYDGDGDLDTILAQGSPRYFENVGNGALVERTGTANPFDGLFSISDNVAFGDLDHDGDLDLVVVQADGHTRVLWNNSSYGAKPNSLDGSVRIDFGFEGEAGTPHAPTGGIALGGVPIQGEVLTAQSTLADEDGIGTLHYQWQRDTGSGFVDVGSDQATYTLGAGDVGGTIRVTVSYIDGLFMTESVTTTFGTPISADTRAAQLVTDTLGDKPWTSVTTKYDDLGGIKTETFALDNGGVWINTYDTSGVSPILWVSKRFDPSNNFMQRTTTFDDGTHSLTVYDVNNAYGWANLTISFDANWMQTGVTGVRDDLTTGISQSEVVAVLDDVMWFATPYDPNFASAGTSDSVTGGAGADVMYGFDGNDALSGMNGDDFIVGGRGADTLTGGAGADRFSFRTGDGIDLVTDFEAGSDVLDLHGYGVTSFADLLARMAQDGDKVVITLDAENAITLDHVVLGDLSASDFMFS